jgi:transcription-repair coupling factor (superfamily II helicase)
MRTGVRWPATAGRASEPLLARLGGLFGVGDLDEASALLEGADVEETTWDTDSLIHHRAHPDDRLVAQDRLFAEVEARREFLSGWRMDPHRLRGCVRRFKGR